MYGIVGGFSEFAPKRAESKSVGVESGMGVKGQGADECTGI